MAVKLRLMRMGKKKHPTYRVVAADSRSPRDGRIIELIGRYDPHPHPSVVEIDNERALHWLQVGAQPTDAVRKLLEISGAWGQFRVARGDVHVVGDVAPPPEKEKLSKKAKARAAEEAEAAPDEPDAGEAEAPDEPDAGEAEAPDEPAAGEAEAADEAAAGEAEAAPDGPAAEEASAEGTAATEAATAEAPAEADVSAGEAPEGAATEEADAAVEATEPVAESDPDESESEDTAEEKA